MTAAGLLSDALARHRAGHGTEADSLYRRLIADFPAAPEAALALTNLGVLALERGEMAAALDYHDQALALAPDLAAAWCNRGDALAQSGRAAEADGDFAQAARLDAALAPAWFNRGNALMSLGRAEEAAACYGQAQTLLPDLALVPLLLGQALARCGRTVEAGQAFTRATALEPGLAEAHRGLGVALYTQGRPEEAIHCFDRALDLRPDHAETGSDFLNCLHYLPEAEGAPLAEAHRRVAARLPGPAATNYANSREPERRLRIGYVSADFRRHPLGLLMRPVLAHHDRRGFAVTCYATRTGGDEITAELKGHAENWRDAAGTSDTELAARVTADAIDILVDLDGHTAGNRLGVFARKPAPVQVTWLGYPFSTGLTAMDYALMDRATVPPEAEPWFSETVALLPVSRLCYQGPDEPLPAPPPLLANGFVTFGSFNNIAKLNPRVMAAWAGILAKVPDSRLLLKWPHLAEEAIANDLLERFAAAGLDPSRITLRGPSPPTELLTQYGEMDIALDPFPYCGAFTSCEALWMGVPVVSLPGERPFSRQSYALLAAMGLADRLCAGDLDSYRDKAAELSRDPVALSELRQALRPMMRQSLGDGAAHVRALEDFFRQAWRRWCA